MVLKVVGKESNSNIYCLTGLNVTNTDELLYLNDEQRELIIWELGEAALSFIECDVATDRLSMGWQDPGVDVPSWERYDKNG